MDMPQEKTVRIEAVAGYRALWMIWSHQVNRQDVNPAFRELVNLLNQARGPLRVVVDLRQNPQFPLNETLTGALSGPFRHPHLAEWLMIGSSPMAQAIARALSAVTLRRNLLWFESEAEVFAYLEAQGARHGELA